MKKTSFILTALFFILVLAACQPGLAQTSSHTATVWQTPTFPPTNTPIPEPTKTSPPAPTATFPPTATFTPMPTYSAFENGAITFWSDSEKTGSWALYQYDIQDGRITKLTDSLFRLEGFGANDPNVISYLGGANYQLSSNGQYVAASYASIFDVIDVSTGENIQIVIGHNHFDTALAWHPTEPKLAYQKKGLQIFDGNTQTTERISNLNCLTITWDIATEGIICSTGWEIYYIPLDSRNPVELARIERQGELYDIQVTEDGTSIFVRLTDKILLKGTMARNESIELQNFLEPFDFEVSRIPYYSLNPQGKYIAVTIEYIFPSSDLYIIDIQSNSILCEVRGYIHHPAWTNDGKLLMYEVNYEGLHKIRFVDIEHDCQIVKEFEIDGRATDIQLIEY